MTSAQEVVNKVDAKDPASLEKSLAAVEAARAACEKAELGREREELLKAKNQLSAQLDYIRKKANRRETRKLTPEQLAVFLKSGDPSCPKGQGYKHKPSGKEIKCAGPQIVEMSWPSAKDYFESRGYKVTTLTGPPTLKAEYGAELYVFSYSAVEDLQAARCVRLYPPPGIPWQEWTSRATGTPPNRLKPGGTVKSAHGDLPLQVEDTESKVLVHIGSCAGVPL